MVKQKLIMSRKADKRWANGAIIYQIYPRSFQDSNGDGIGDIPGIIQRLDYLKQLGISGIWISPFYPSPMADFGYDVSDYRGIDPIFGTLDDFKKLLYEAHLRDIHVMVDIVPNHTSDEHPWFVKSKRSRTGKYSDWYIWRDPIGYEDGEPIPPNNWLGVFDGQSAWKWVPERRQFYLHSFHTKQPDLNWNNRNVREAIKDVFRYWLDMGVDGFRVDAVSFIAKDPSFTDNPLNPDYIEGEWKTYDRLKHVNNQYWPQLYSHVSELANVLDEKPYRHRPRFMVTEGYVPREDVIGGYMQFYKSMNPKVAAPFIFEGINRPWDARDWRAFLRDFHGTLDWFNKLAISSYAFGNHDQSRIVSRYGVERARAIAVVQLTLPGMIYVYNGEELGMHDVDIPKDRVMDPGAIDGGGRDPERTPMQWSNEINAGFTVSEPWLPLARDWRKHNVDQEKIDPDSFLNLYKKLGQLRQNSSALRHGKIKVQFGTNEHILAFSRTAGREKYSIVVNFAEEPVDYHLKTPGRVVISSQDSDPSNRLHISTLRLNAYEAIVIKHK